MKTISMKEKTLFIDIPSRGCTLIISAAKGEDIRVAAYPLDVPSDMIDEWSISQESIDEANDGE